MLIPRTALTSRTEYIGRNYTTTPRDARADAAADRTDSRGCLPARGCLHARRCLNEGVSFFAEISTFASFGVETLTVLAR
jgi:hypothetical protein